MVGAIHDRLDFEIEYAARLDARFGPGTFIDHLRWEQDTRSYLDNDAVLDALIEARQEQLYAQMDAYDDSRTDD